MILNLSRSPGPRNNKTLTKWTPTFTDLEKVFKSPSPGTKHGSYFVRGPVNDEGKRLDKNIGPASLLILDGDRRMGDDRENPKGAPPIEDMCRALRTLDIPHILYTSASHMLPEKGIRYRVLIPCEIPNKDTLEWCVNSLISTLHQMDVPLLNVSENTTWSQPWYFPRMPKDRMQLYQCISHKSSEPFTVERCIDLTKPPEARTGTVPNDQAAPAQPPAPADNRGMTNVTQLPVLNPRRAATEADQLQLLEMLENKGQRWDALRRIASSYARRNIPATVVQKIATALIQRGDPTWQWDTPAQKALQSAYDKFKPLDRYKDDNSERGKRLAKRISDQLAEALGVDDEEAPKVDHEAIDRMINRAFWSGSRGKLFLLNDSNSVNQYTEGDAWRFLCRACGTPLDMTDIAEKAKSVIIGVSKKEIEKQINSILAIPRSVVLSDLKWTNQRDHVQWRVDMFADQPRMELLEDAARIVLPHVGFPDYGEPEPDIVADYMEHFPELERVMSMIVAARFAGDRKKAYLWMLASSDWGKGFFTACLRELGLVVEMSVKEIERVFEGQPAGKRPEQFKRAWVLAVNEFKSVKAEVKQLESVIQIAPKYQLTSEVELFAKLFLSAENVASLVTDHGVEDQFLKRFSLIDKQGTIDDRPLFARDRGRYRRSVVAWMSRYLNRAVADYQRLGRDAADRDATKALHDFHAEYGLANFHASFSHSMKDVAREFRDWLDDLGSQDSQANLWCSDGERYRCLKNASRALEHFLNERMSSEQVPTIKRRKDDIFKYLSVDGKGNYPHRFAGQVGKVRCVRFERLSE